MSAARRRHELQPAWILSSRPYRETSLLLEWFSPGQGRVGGVARSARGPRSRSRGLLQILQPLLLSWSEAGELATLQAAEAASPPLPLQGEALFCAWYLNELLLRLLPRQDPHPRLFEAYGEALAALGAGPLEPPLRRFELDLLDELGYGLDWPDGEAEAWLHREDGGWQPTAAETPGALPAAALAWLASGAGETATPGELRAARDFLRGRLAPLLGGRELESARLLRELRSRAPAAPPRTGT
ncbi:MAG TPA: DNA repair protein RecO [Nevskiaceae bacterium]|nr:DNA repair protein RecO [Nevskiaceae bacterium]